MNIENGNRLTETTKGKRNDGGRAPPVRPAHYWISISQTPPETRDGDERLKTREAKKRCTTRVINACAGSQPFSQARLVLYCAYSEGEGESSLPMIASDN